MDVWRGNTKDERDEEMSTETEMHYKLLEFEYKMRELDEKIRRYEMTIDALLDQLKREHQLNDELCEKNDCLESDVLGLELDIEELKKAKKK